jgi:CBS domain-containing protein
MDIGGNLRNETVQQAGPLVSVCVEPDLPTRAVLEMLRNLGRGAILVCRDGVLVGIFTERDALRVLASEGDASSPISAFMTRNPVTVRESDSVETAIGRMAANRYRRLPIVDAEGRPSGILDVSGIIHWLVDHFPKAVYNLPPVAKVGTQEREGP